jgi:Zn-dependent peptidase ImmA (M78 family)
MLMPAHDIRSHLTWRSGLADFAQLKLHGRVSMASLIRRAHDLKVITDGHYTNLQRQMSGAGYRRCEPNEFEPEQPTTIREMVRVHVEDLGFTASELATLLSLDLEDVRRFFLNDLEADDEAPSGTSKPRLRLVE